jgi:hypothetical protein
VLMQKRGVFRARVADREFLFLNDHS